MSTKFVMFTGPHNKPILINSAHIRTATEVGGQNTRVRLVMGLQQDGEYVEEVEGDLKSVWAKLTEKRSEPPTPPPRMPSIYGGS